MPDVALRAPKTPLRVVLLRIALGMAHVLIIAIVVYRTFWRSPEELLSLPVAAETLASGQEVTPGRVRYEFFPRGQVRDEYLRGGIVGRFVRASIPQGKPFLNSDLEPLLDRGAPNKVKLEDGWVVVSVDPAKVEAPTGMMAPDSLVAILASKDHEAFVVCPGAYVVSTPERDKPSPLGVREDKISVPLVLRVPISDAANFVKADRMRLVLLASPQDGAKLLPPPPHLPAKPRPAQPIEVIRGTQTSWIDPSKSSPPRGSLGEN